MFGQSKKRVYLDWAAASPVSPRAERVFAAALSACGNPSAAHVEARAARAVLDDARTKIARLAEVRTEGVIFTSGATEANALAILGSVRARGVSGAHVLYQAGAHASVIAAVKMLEQEGARIEEIRLADVGAQLTPETALVALDAVNSETGEVFDALSVRRVLDAHRARGGTALLHVDAAQAPRARGFTLATMGADMVTLDAQKVGGVRGIGALLVRQGIMLLPLYGGGGQEGGRRSGTESPALASAFASALMECSEAKEKFTEKSARMRANLIERISGIENMFVNEGKEKVSHILNVSLLGRDTDYLVTLLDTEGFAVATRSACESSHSGRMIGLPAAEGTEAWQAGEGSRPVLALTGDAERARTTLRISWGPSTGERDLDLFAEALIRNVRFLDENAI